MRMGICQPWAWEKGKRKSVLCVWNVSDKSVFGVGTLVSSSVQISLSRLPPSALPTFPMHAQDARARL
jgi:hypothetical protein